MIQPGVTFDCNDWAEKPIYGPTVFKPRQVVQGGEYKGNWAGPGWEREGRQGLGAMKYAQSGAVYEGWWFDDMRNGIGKLTHPNN